MTDQFLRGRKFSGRDDPQFAPRRRAPEQVFGEISRYFGPQQTIQQSSGSLPPMFQAIGRLVSADMTMTIVASPPPACRRGSSGSQRGEPKAIA